MATYPSFHVRHGAVSNHKDEYDKENQSINQEKTEFFVINICEGNAEPIRLDDLIINSCTINLYSGSPFTCDGSVSSAVQIHA